jgi:hypothetical protein
VWVTYESMNCSTPIDFQENSIHSAHKGATERPQSIACSILVTFLGLKNEPRCLSVVIFGLDVIRETLWLMLFRSMSVCNIVSRGKWLLVVMIRTVRIFHSNVVHLEYVAASCATLNRPVARNHHPVCLVGISWDTCASDILFLAVRFDNDWVVNSSCSHLV